MAKDSKQLRAAARFEAKGFIAIRAYHHVAPPLIVFPAALKDQVMLVYVASPGEDLNEGRKAAIDAYLKDGFNVLIDTIEPAGPQGISKAEIDAICAEGDALGYQGFKTGLRRHQWPKDRYKYQSKRWYDLRGAWRAGWDRAEEEANPGAHVHKI